jgi:MSHA biogenesis protein MshO
MTKFQRGFTLVEAVIVIAITGIIAAVVAVFIQAPIKGYFDSARRAEMTDIADTALRRISRDLRLALPNSVRVTGANTVIEFLQTRTGGRYRSERGSTTAENDILDFSDPADTTFELLGPPMTFNAGDQIVIYNLGIDGANAYQGNTAATHVRRALNIAGVGTTTTVRIDSASPFPFDSPSHSFQVVDAPVTYICDAGTLRRYWGYAIQPSQQETDTVAELDALVTPSTATSGTAVLAQNVTSCVFTYEPGVTERSGLVTLRLSTAQSNETITLYQEVHVSNVP